MRKISTKIWAFLTSYTLFIVISKALFLNIYDTPGYVVDELFHIPQGLTYCNFNFTSWDPKITTLPGLYLLSTIWAPFGLCTVYGMRLTNFIAGIANFLLFVELFHIEYDNTKKRKKFSWSGLFSGINASILPPLYFFNHFYYTDTVSVTSVLIMVMFAKKGWHGLAAVTGIFGVIIRQTNIIWVVMLFGEKVLDVFVKITSEKRRKSKKYPHNTRTGFWKLYECIRNIFKEGHKIKKVSRSNYISLCSYLSVIVLFLIFILINGSIVVGDKSAHQAAIHIPQFFYFSLFTVIFAAPHYCLEIVPFIQYVWRNKLLSMGLLSLLVYIVHCNTLVHPYLLADNRHYTFYVWNRIYGKYPAAKYVLTLVYFFGMYAALKRVDAINNFSFILTYVPCTLLVLILQKLLDVRYFLIPFILLRLKFKTRNVTVLVVELLLYLIINYLTFYVFFSKEIFWNDFEEAQRIIW